jgi:hypothetical protein
LPEGADEKSINDALWKLADVEEVERDKEMKAI